MSFDNIGAIDCSTQTCADTLPAAAAQDQFCPENVTLSEINSLILWSANGTAPTNWGSSIASTDFNIDNTLSDGTSQKQFFGVGSIAEAEDSEVTLNDDQTQVVERTRTLTFTLFDLPEATYDFLRNLQCGKYRPRIFYTDRGEFIYGVDGGLVLKQFRVNFPKNTGNDAVNQAVITAVFAGLTDPDRYANPL